IELSGVSVLLGDGKGTFFLPDGGEVGVGSSPSFAAAGDFNGDGTADLIVANASSNNLTLLLAGKAATSTSAFTENPTTFTYGTLFSLGANVATTGMAFSSPTGSATLFDGANNFGNAPETATPYSFSSLTLGGGTHSLTVVYNGDARNKTSTST